MFRLALPLTGALVLGGCVVYDDTLSPDEDGRHVIDDGDNHDPDDPDNTFAVWLNPAGAKTGESAIISLFGEGDIDLDEITQVTFFGDSEIELHTTTPRSRYEHLIGLSVPEQADIGDNDLLVEFEDGRAVFLEDAFAVVADEEDIPDSPSGPDEGDDGDDGQDGGDGGDDSDC